MARAPALAPVSCFHRCLLSPPVGRKQRRGSICYVLQSPKSQVFLSDSPSSAGVSTLASERRRSQLNWDIERSCEMGNLREAMTLICHPDFKSCDVDSDVFCRLLQLCADLRSIEDGRKVHLIISASGAAVDAALGSKLVFMYVECGSLAEGRRVFDRITVRDQPFLWNLLIKEYSKAGEFEESVHLFKLMHSLGVKPDSYTFSCILKCFSALGRTIEGQEAHGYAIKLGFHCYNTVGNSLVSFYSKCRKIDVATLIFDEMLDKDIVSWNSVISGCALNGLHDRGLELFSEMWFAGLSMDLATLVSVLPACAELGTIKVGQGVHGYGIKTKLMQDVALNNCLIDMYSKCGELDDAVRVFRMLDCKNVVSWTAMISAYARGGQFMEAVSLFGEMISAGIITDLFAITTVLHACACSGSLGGGKHVHNYIVKYGLEKNIFVANALIDMYAKCGDMEAATQVFNETMEKDIISWNALIGGHSKNSNPNEALKLLRKMLSHLRPNSVTIACVLPSIASLSILDKGREIHAHILRAGYVTDGFLANALVDMYAKCGALLLARLLFDRIIVKDLISWTVMISGYGMHGHGRKAITVFKQMRRKGIIPDEVSFVAILYACSHSGLVEEGWIFFNIMRNEYRIEPKLEHYACMVDLLSRSGHLTKAYKFIEAMPIQPDATIWGALLCGCRIHRDVKLAEKVAEKVFELEPENTGYYVLLANIYTEAEKWESVKKIRTRIGRQGLQKNPSCSWVEIKSKVHVFVAGETWHPQSRKIESFLEEVRRRMKHEGYVPKTRYALLNDDEAKKEEALCGHSERLAIAFAILNTSKGRPVRVVKNLRVCGDCHEVVKFISSMTEREIILRDSNRFHHFEEGRCTCRGCW